MALIAGVAAGMKFPAPDTGGADAYIVMDFVSGTYTVDGASVAVGSLLASPLNYELAGTVFDPSQIVPGRGMLVSETPPYNGPAASGALKSALLAPYTAVLEWEDFWEGTGDVFGYIANEGSGSLSYVHRTWVEPDYGRLRCDGAIADLLVATDWATKWSGTNRLAFTLGTTASNISINTRSALKQASIDTSAIFGAKTWVEVVPFGSFRSSSAAPLNGFVRKLTIYPPQPASALLALSSIEDVPGSITDIDGNADAFKVAAVTQTSITLEFEPAPRAESYEYWIKQTASNDSPDPVESTWHPLPSDKMITGLTANTAYRVFIRARNTAGMSRLAERWAGSITTAA